MAVALFTIAVPVRAQSDHTACPEGAGCVWDQTDFRGRKAEVPSTGCIDSNIKSAVNGSDEPLELFTGAGCYGPRAGVLMPGQESPQIHAGSATNDCTHDAVDQCTGDAGDAPTP
jgi:hypothetical protein